MSAHKYTDKICCIIVVLTIVITVLFMNGEALGIKKLNKSFGYEDYLFNTEKVHSINIICDDWDSFISQAKSEEYVTCSAVIDNETFKNIAIRAKGNTSLTNVDSYGNNRYSFKIEFDHYDESINYHGLDKLSLNNIIQDNTYVKDFLTYKMMSDFGVDSPLSSFVYIKVNGEDFGLYLAVEGVEDSFLERNYGNDYGELYKPDSQSMGGGVGNGKDFNMDDFKSKEESSDSETKNTDTATKTETTSDKASDETTEKSFDDNQPPNMPDGNMMNFELGLDEIKKFIESADDDTLEEIAEALEYSDVTAMKKALSSAEDADEFLNGKSVTDIMSSFKNGDISFPEITGNSDGKDNNGGKGGMNSSDVSLIYSDDEISSYSNIFNNAKTNASDSDKQRLISSIKQLNNNENISEVVNVDEVIRYFVVHNFVLNFDSYTGSMIHNYYLYEKDGQLSMIPWDYNLAFGGFQSQSDATSLANYPIDSPVSGGTIDSRPMLAWIFANSEYTNQYHKYFLEFIENYFDSGYFDELIDSVKEMISPYVKKDPTKFCTYDEFIKGIDTLKSFCQLRAESITGQLDGSIPSTSDEQKTSSDSLIDASALTISDMGSMGNSMGKMPDNKAVKKEASTQSAAEKTTTQAVKETTTAAEKQKTTETAAESNDGTSTAQGFGGQMQPQNANQNGEPPEMPDGEMPQGMGQGGDPPEMPNGEMPQDMQNMTPTQNSDTESTTEKSTEKSTEDTTASSEETTTEKSETKDDNAVKEQKNKPSESTKSDSQGTSGTLLLIISFAVLIFGLIVALIFKKQDPRI